MIKQVKLIKRKAGLFKLAEELGNVSQACKLFGYSRDSFYRFKELYRAGSAHLHPVAKETQVDIATVNRTSSTIYNIHGGHPSGIPGEGAGDYQEHERSFQANSNRRPGNNVRSIMVDSKNIYLYNSSPNQTIVIPRPTR